MYLLCNNLCCLWFVDQDVLDTWFSSGIFPFSIFGWPDKVIIRCSLSYLIQSHECNMTHKTIQHTACIHLYRVVFRCNCLIPDKCYSSACCLLRPLNWMCFTLAHCWRLDMIFSSSGWLGWSWWDNNWWESYHSRRQVLTQNSS